jgi:hypothetical protein
MWKMTTACVIMHNRIVEDERDASTKDQGWAFHGDLIEPFVRVVTFQEFLHAHHEIRDWTIHN